MSKITACLFLLLAACNPPTGTRDLNAYEWGLVVDVGIAWDQYPGLPLITDHCWAHLEAMGVAHPQTQTAFMRATGACGEGLPGTMPDGCTVLSGQHRQGYIGRGSVIVLTLPANVDPSTFNHEVLHSIGSCMLGDPDSSHSKDYWGVVAPR